MTRSRLAVLPVALALVAVACGSDTSDATQQPAAAQDDSATPVGQSPSTTGAPSDTARSAEEGRVPDVDLSRHAVPVEEIYFDTFDGGSVRLSDSTEELRDRLLDAIPPIDRPVYGDAAGGDWLSDTDLVLGYLAGEQAYAYPFKILNFHEIVNDELGGIPVLISYCPLCGSGIVYDRRVDGDVLSFGNTSALYESDMVMVDRSTGSYWWQVAGTGIVGPLTDSALTPLPSVVSSWSDWVLSHPDTLVLTRDTGFERPYERDSFSSYGEYLDGGNFAFPVGEAARDGRLPPSVTVVGIVSDGGARAYPIGDSTEPINDEFDGTPVVVFPVAGGGSVFVAETNDGSPLHFAAEDGGIVDEQTGSTWTTEGRATDGPMAGTRLTPIPARTTFWFAFVGAFPNVEVYGG